MGQGEAPQSRHEPWAIRLPGDEAVRKPGENLREWARDDRGRARRFFDRVTAREERDPRLAGAWGEEVVGGELAKLDDDWTVVHGVRIGPKADVDHLVVGPSGVFSLNTKRVALEARVHVSARRFVVNGYSRDYYPKAVREAQRVAERLHAATGLDIVVQPVIVLTGVDRSSVQIREQPDDVAVVLRRGLHAWLRTRPPALAPDVRRQLADAIRRPSTWDPSKVGVVLDRQPPPTTIAKPPPVAVAEPPVATLPPPPAAADVPEGSVPVEIVEWRRYGHHRRYVNDKETGDSLGWRDERTGRVHVEDGVDPATVFRALSAAGVTGEADRRRRAR